MCCAQQAQVEAGYGEAGLTSRRGVLGRAAAHFARTNSYTLPVYKTPAKLAIGAQLFGAPGLYVLATFVLAHLALVWSARTCRAFKPS